MKENLTDFSIDPDIFSKLKEIASKLPSHATGYNKKDSMPTHDYPAGLALLGMENNKIDTVISLAMSGGCWDAPNINYEDMYKGIEKLISKDKICVGFALIRNPKWYSNVDEAQISKHLRRQVCDFRTSFENIFKTVWIVLHNNNFRIYRPYDNGNSKIGLRELNINKFFSEEDKKDSFIKSKLKLIEKVKEEKRMAKELDKKRKEEWLRYEAEQEELRKKEIERKEKSAQNKLDNLNKKIKLAKDDTIDVGNGLSLIKNKEGKYILWQTR